MYYSVSAYLDPHQMILGVLVLDNKRPMVPLQMLQDGIVK